MATTTGRNGESGDGIRVHADCGDGNRYSAARRIASQIADVLESVGYDRSNAGVRPDARDPKTPVVYAECGGFDLRLDGRTIQVVSEFGPIGDPIDVPASIWPEPERSFAVALYRS